MASIIITFVHMHVVVPVWLYVIYTGCLTVSNPNEYASYHNLVNFSFNKQLLSTLVCNLALLL